MKKTAKYSKLISGNDEKAIGVIYFDDLYKAQIFVELKTKTFHIVDVVNYPNTNYNSFDEMIKNAVEESGISTKAEAISISKDEFHSILEKRNLGKDFIIKIKEKFPEEIVKDLLNNK